MSDDRGSILLAIARAEIAKKFGLPHALHDTVHENRPWLSEHGASFVTLTEHGELRGCIGTLEAHRPLLLDVKANALAAAFLDPRFPPLLQDELNHVSVEVSLLEPPRPMSFRTEQDAMAQLIPGEDGVILQFWHHRGTFLPQVWEQLPDPRRFLAHLKHKAGLPTDFWSPEVKLSRYRVEKWKE